MKKKKLIILVLIVLFIAVGSFCSLKIYNKDRIDFTINDTLPDGDNKKAKVIILAGQSNASGCSSDTYLKKNVSAEKYAEYNNGYDNIYINYFIDDFRNKLYYKSDGFVKCTTRQGQNSDWFGPELGMAERLNQLYPGETIFIIKFAHGDTNLFEDWLSPSSQGKTGKYYKQFIDFTKKSIKYLKSKNYDVEIEGMCWMQGESDSFSVEHSTKYVTHLTNFIADIRDDLSRYAAKDGIAFVDAYIAANPMYWVYYYNVNQGKYEVSKASEMNVLVDTIAHGLTTSSEPEDKPDVAHYDSLSEIKLGHLFIEHLVPFL